MHPALALGETPPPACRDPQAPCSSPAPPVPPLGLLTQTPAASTVS